MTTYKRGQSITTKDSFKYDLTVISDLPSLGGVSVLRGTGVLQDIRFIKYANIQEPEKPKAIPGRIYCRLGNSEYLAVGLSDGRVQPVRFGMEPEKFDPKYWI